MVADLRGESLTLLFQLAGAGVTMLAEGDNTIFQEVILRLQPAVLPVCGLLARYDVGIRDRESPVVVLKLLDPGLETFLGL